MPKKRVQRDNKSRGQNRQTKRSRAISFTKRLWNLQRRHNLRKSRIYHKSTRYNHTLSRVPKKIQK